MSLPGPVGTTSATGRRQRWLPLVAPALLAALALTQITLAFAVGLSPWKGGGFGMFASTDHEGFRRLVAVAVSDSGETPLRIPPERARQRRAATLLPSHGRLLALAEALAPGAPAGARSIRIAVARSVFSAPDLAPHWEPVAVLTLPLVAEP